MKKRGQHWQLLAITYKTAFSATQEANDFFFFLIELKELRGKLWSDNYKCGEIKITNDKRWVKELWITVAMSWTAGCWSPTQTPTYGKKDWYTMYTSQHLRTITPADKQAGRLQPPQREYKCSRIHSQSISDKRTVANLSMNLLNLFC